MIILYEYAHIYLGGHNMEIDWNYEKRTHELQDWCNSSAHQPSCQYFQEEFERLSQIAAKQQHSVLEAHRETSTVRREFASKSDLHRGIYCPSPVYDLIVGNTHRGKLLKRMTTNSKPTHTYGFDSKNQLLWCDSIHNGSVTMTEYLITQDNAVYGITYDRTHAAYIITEEVYQDGKLIQYTHCLCPSLNGSAQCVELRCEKYQYDEEGLYHCTWHKYSNLSDLPSVCTDASLSSYLMPTYDRSDYLFKRRDKFLVSYTTNGITYHPRIQRRADQFYK